nr:putative ribonuclease H-like domain-containing protein [Tanacetum cinerariifolium]
MNTDHNLWKIIQNRNSKKSLGRDLKGGIMILLHVSFEEHVVVQRETKARTLLLQSLPEDHMADFHHLDDAREIWLAVKARFGGNDESKKMTKTMLKQAFSEFSVSEEEGLHKGYNRFQKILSQLNQIQEKPDNDDVNIKFLRALPYSWSQFALTLKTRGCLEYLSVDDLYNKLRSLEIDVKGGSSYGLRSTTVVPTHSAFIGAASTNTKVVITEDVLHSFVAKNEPTQQLAYEDFKHVDQLEMEELNIKWQMAMLSLRINKFQKKEGMKINFNNKDSARFNRRKARCYNCLQLRHFARECNVKKVDEKASVNPDAAKFAMMGISPKKYIGSDEVCDLSTPSVFDPEPENKEVKSLYERFVKAGKMHEVSPPITGTFMPTSYKSDLAETQATFGLKSNTSSLNTSDTNDFVSCDNSDKSLASETYDFTSCVLSPKTNDSFSTVDVKILPKFDVKDPSRTNGFPSCSFKETIKPTRSLCNKSGLADRIHCKNNFVRHKKCFVCGSKSYLIKDCDVYDTIDNFPSVVSKAASVPAGSRNSLASIHAGRSIPAASRNRPASIHTGRSIPAASRNRPTSIYAGRHIPAGRINKPAHFPAGRSVPTGWTNHAARPFFGPTNLYFDNVYWPGIYDHMLMNKGQWGSAVKSSAGIVDSGCSRSMTGNKEKLDDFVQIKGSTVAFGGGDDKITGKGIIQTSKLNFENVYYMEELQNFNLFSVSQICDKMNKVLFTDDEYLVLTKEFQLPDESQVVLRIPRRHNLYAFNLSDIQPEQHINYLLAKASLEESTKWHKRMAHVNFKTINKLAKNGLVEGLPLKLFTNEHNCVACNKGKSIDHKYYSLVVTDDFSRFSWAFFLGTKDETFYILKDFIALIENQLNKKIKVIRVSITNTHNKTPYELLYGKVPNIRHLKPFGCQVTILNTSDHLGKFEGKANDGFLVGYAAHSYTRFKTNPPAGTYDTNIIAGTQDDDSESECDEQVILVRSFPSNSFSGPKVHDISAPIEDNLDYAEELARLQRQEHEAHSAAAKYGFEFPNATAEMLHQAEIETCRNLVLAAGDPAGSIVSTGGVLAGSVPAGSIPTSSVPAGSVPASHVSTSSAPAGSILASHVSAGSVPASHVPASSIPAGGVLTGSIDSAASNVAVDPVATKRVNTIHSQSQIIRELQSPVQIRKPSSMAKAFEDLDWVAAMQEEMQQFYNQDAKGIVVRNKARLVAQGHRQEEGIDYDEVFAPVAKIEAIRLFLAFTSYMGFMVYQMDVKSAFLYREIKEEVYVTQPKGFEDPHNPKHVYRVVKSLYGFHQAPRACQDKYVKDMLKKFDMESVRTATTPYEVLKHKSKDKLDDAVNVHLYRSMIGSLMYLITSRPDIMFAVSACSRHQCKKQTVVATSSTEAEYVAAASCCGQILLSGCPYWDAQSLGRPPILLVVPVFLLVVLVPADGWVPTGSCTIPTGRGVIGLGYRVYRVGFSRVG